MCLVARLDLFNGGSCQPQSMRRLREGKHPPAIFQQPVIWVAWRKRNSAEVKLSNSHPAGEYAMVGRMERCDTRLSTNKGRGEFNNGTCCIGVDNT